MSIISMPNNKKFEDNYDRIFKRDKVEGDERSEPHACFCTGPEPGETECPCALRKEDNG